MSPALQPYVALAGRVLLSMIFLLNGINKIMHWPENIEYMQQHGLPALSLLLTGAIIVEILGGLALLLGLLTRVSTLILFLYLIPTTLIFHAFWTFTDPGQYQQMMIHFLKNLAIMGGLLAYCASGAGALSIDAAVSQRPSVPGMFSRAGRRPI